MYYYYYYYCTIREKLRWNNTLKYGDFINKMNLFKTLEHLSKHFKMILPNFAPDECGGTKRQTKNNTTIELLENVLIYLCSTR